MVTPPENGTQPRRVAEIPPSMSRVLPCPRAHHHPGGALRLDEVEHAHLRDLAAPTSRRRAATSHTPQRADPGLLRLIDTLARVPVLLLGRRGDVLARNALLCAVLGRPIEPGPSFVRFLFLDPIARERIVNWSHLPPPRSPRCAARPAGTRTTVA